MQEINKHKQYSLMEADLLKVRTAVKGSPFVKAAGQLYLPNVSMDKTSTLAGERYNQYLAGAEFDGIPQQTLVSTLGRMGVKKTQFVVPDKLLYLLDNADGDGLSLNGVIESCVSNVSQVGYHILVADYQGLPATALGELSVADMKKLKPRATIKQYSRESLLYWHSRKVNGVMQWDFLLFVQQESRFDPVSVVEKAVNVYLALGLDEEGNYYQEKWEESAESNGTIVRGDRSAVLVGGQPLKWIPVSICANKELSAGELPIELGWLAPICDKTYARYVNSANWALARADLVPTTYIKGWEANSNELFEEANGRRFFVTGSGSVNVLPGIATVEVLSGGGELKYFESYAEQNEREIRALGGVFQTQDSSTNTATEAAINSAEQTARLISIADSVENAVESMLLYCGMFEGLWQQDSIEQNKEQIEVNIPRDFAMTKLSADEVRVLMELRMSGLPDSEFINLLAQGGWTVSDAEELLNQLDSGDNLQGNT